MRYWFSPVCSKVKVDWNGAVEIVSERDYVTRINLRSACEQLFIRYHRIICIKPGIDGKLRVIEAEVCEIVHARGGSIEVQIHVT